MEYENDNDGTGGLYIDPETGKVILQIQKYTTVNFNNLNEVSDFHDRLGRSLATIKSRLEGDRQLDHADATSAVEEFQRIVADGLSKASRSLGDNGGDHHPHLGGIFDRSTTAEVSSPGIGHDLVDSYWKVTLMGMTGRHKTKLIKGIKGLNDLGYEYRKQLVESCPSVVMVTRTRVEANMIKARLESIGGVVDVSLGMGKQEQDESSFLWKLHLLEVSESNETLVTAAMTATIGYSVHRWSEFINNLPNEISLWARMKDIASIKQAMDEVGAVTRVYPARVFRVPDDRQ